VHHAAPDKKYIVESMSGGVALLDFDNDGRVDIYFTDALTVATAKDPKAARSALYRNLGHGRFEDVTDKAGVGHPGWAMGVCTADVDGDGWEDIYVTGFGRNASIATTTTAPSPTSRTRLGLGGGGWSAGCGFADYDRDGELDLFVSRYVKMDLGNLPEFGQGKTCTYRGIAVQCGPRGLPGESDFLFHNDGDGHFTEVSEKAGVADARGYFGMGIAWFDSNDDGWPDLYVANDSGPNYLYLNQKNGTFKDAAFAMGVAVSEDGGEQGSMGVALGDYENVGRQSLYITNFAEEYKALYRNDGDHFTDVSFRPRRRPAACPTWAGALRSSTTTTTAGSTSSRSTATCIRSSERATSARPRLSPAEAAVSQPRRRDVRRGGGAVRARLHGETGEPRSGRRGSRRRRTARRGDQRPRRRARRSCTTSWRMRAIGSWSS
jgi:hypothetical protein